MAELAKLVIQQTHREWHTPFSDLYDLVRNGRNDAMHQGVAARHLTGHAVQLALTLEDALMNDAVTIGDYMVRNPVCAEMWQPISFVRQQMLMESFSYLPVFFQNQWCLISDYALAQYLRVSHTKADRKERLAKTLEKAVAESELTLHTSVRFSEAAAKIETVMNEFDGKPILVCRCNDSTTLIGILTAFDLL